MLQGEIEELIAKVKALSHTYRFCSEELFEIGVPVDFLRGTGCILWDIALEIERFYEDVYGKSNER
ncbi:MAG: hypothetical protein DRH11_12590 [Deltaproteobacteria bacterium]|nr:MAG: hypothetical protein DRH11_12590 [Deltaproteobacteria bacterium]